MAVAVIFPGQGSQSVGMLGRLSEPYHSIRDSVFEQASAFLGFDMTTLIENGPVDVLNQTETTQPVLLTVNHMVWLCWQKVFQGQSPKAFAGHSLGEFNALVAAGCLRFEDALKLVAYRGQLMQAAVPADQGAMAAILGLPDDVVEAICREVSEGEVVAPANYNSPGQLVIAGQAAAVERAMLQAKAAGAKKVLVLPVSVPSHTALMAEAAEALAERLEGMTVSLPALPIIHNLSATQTHTVEELRRAIVGQLASPVQWTRCIRALVSLGCTEFYECGPGKVLTGLGRRIDRDQQWIAFEEEISQ